VAGGMACTEPVGDKEVEAQSLSWPTVEIHKWADVNDELFSYWHLYYIVIVFSQLSKLYKIFYFL
jgi:hypothetical protein